MHDVEDIWNKVGMDVLLLCGIYAFFVQFLFRYAIKGAKEICHEDDYGSLKNSCILIYLGTRMGSSMATWLWFMTVRSTWLA